MRTVRMYMCRKVTWAQVLKAQERPRSGMLGQPYIYRILREDG
jgi:hypothetical protein